MAVLAIAVEVSRDGEGHRLALRGPPQALAACLCAVSTKRHHVGDVKRILGCVAVRCGQFIHLLLEDRLGDDPLAISPQQLGERKILARHSLGSSAKLTRKDRTRRTVAHYGRGGKSRQ